MAYESYFEERVMKHRREEVDKLRRNCVNRAVMNATMASIRTSDSCGPFWVCLISRLC